MSGDSSGREGVDACRTIGEVADELRLPQHVLRFWETRFPQVQPLKRAGGRRFYRPDDVALLRAIRDLLYGEGYTIKGVQRLLADHGPRAFAMEPSAAPGPHPETPRSSGGHDRVPAPTRPPPSLDPRLGAPDQEALVDRLGAVASDLAECGRILAAARGTDR